MERHPFPTTFTLHTTPLRTTPPLPGAAITYLKRSDLTIRASEALETYSNNKTTTPAALHYLRTHHESPIYPHHHHKRQTTYIINTNTINNPSLRSKEKYQTTITRLHSYAATIGTQLFALLVPLQNKYEWNIPNTRPDRYPFLEAIPNATEKIIDAIKSRRSKETPRDHTSLQPTVRTGMDSLQ
jgi:hypothetical protein